MGFPEGFAWGVSSSSYQVEGAAYEDGKGLSTWDVFCAQPGKIFHNHTGDVACDHYHRYAADIALMQELGVAASRFSLCWPRILPGGTGAVNPAGLDFYSRVVDAYLAAGIEPWITLFHWDYPYALYQRGGWLNPDSPDWFADYTGVVMEALSDRVTHWITLCEPACFIGLGHQTGEHAPGLRLAFKEVLQAGHNALLAHGKAVQAIRAGARKEPVVGWAPCGRKFVPASDTQEDIAAARTLTFAVRDRDCFNVTWWLDPMFFGRYPEDGLSLFGSDAPRIGAGDMETIAQPVDFCGINLYSGVRARARKDGTPETLLPPPGYPRTSQSDWHVLPELLYWVPRFLHERYGTPIVITENGQQNLDAPALDGGVHDPQRIDYVRRYLRELRRAVDEGVPVQGYFYWTMMDNFEWAFGYNVRVGLVYTDFQTLARVPKDSFEFYRHVIATNGAEL